MSSRLKHGRGRGKRPSRLTGGNPNSVRVMARFRPQNSKEKKRAKGNTELPVEINGDNISCQLMMSSGDPKNPKTKKKKFVFDRIFSPSSTQEEVFEECARSTLDDVLKGFNGTIFAYGQTGSGKTFSMFGDPENDMEGIIPRSVNYLFDELRKKDNALEVTIKVGFLEIYKEVIRDLLNPKNSHLKVREKPSGDVYVEGLVEEYAQSPHAIMSRIEMGEESRSVSFTDMNAVSSRSHSVVIITITQRLRDGSTMISKLNMADLAGSERVDKTGASGNTLKEAQHINKSLSALGNCINALTDRKRTHVPFRDSTLTKILKDSLGGNTRTTLLVTASPAAFNVDETLSTLRFAQRAKRVTNVARINKEMSISELKATIKRLEELLGLRDKRIKELEQQLADQAAPLGDFSLLSDEDVDDVAEELLAKDTEDATDSTAADQQTEDKPDDAIQKIQEEKEQIEREAKELGAEREELLLKLNSTLDALERAKTTAEKFKAKEEQVSQRARKQLSSMASYVKLLENQLERALDINDEFHSVFRPLGSGNSTSRINLATGSPLPEEDTPTTPRRVDHNSDEEDVVEDSKEDPTDKQSKKKSSTCTVTGCSQRPFTDRGVCVVHLQMAGPSADLVQQVVEKLEKPEEEEEEESIVSPTSAQDEDTRTLAQLRKENSRLKQKVRNLENTWEAHLELVMKNKEFLSKLSDEASGPRFVVPAKAEFVPVETKTYGTLTDTLRRNTMDDESWQEYVELMKSGRQRVVMQGYVFKQTKFTKQWKRRYIVLRVWENIDKSGGSGTTKQVKCWIDNYNNRNAANSGEKPRGALVVDADTQANICRVKHGGVEGFEVVTSASRWRVYADDDIHSKPNIEWVKAIKDTVRNELRSANAPVPVPVQRGSFIGRRISSLFRTASGRSVVSSTDSDTQPATSSSTWTSKTLDRFRKPSNPSPPAARTLTRERRTSSSKKRGSLTGLFDQLSGDQDA